MSESSDDTQASDGIEHSFLSQLNKKSRKQESLSLKDSGLLKNRAFLKKLSIPDRRELSRFATWADKANDLFEKIRKKGGEFYLEYVEELRAFKEEALELYS